MTLVQMQYYKKKYGYSYQKIAELSGVPLSTVQKVLGGITQAPRYETLQALEKVLLPEKDLDNRYRSEEETASEVRETSSYMSGSNARKLQWLTLEDYYALPEEQRVELIDGVFYDMAAPSIRHQIVQMHIGSEIRQYIKSEKGKCLSLIAPTDVQIDSDEYTMVQPDVLVVCDRNKVTARCIVGGPDFIAEILSKSTRTKDMTVKPAKYQNAGVREYWIIDLEKERILVYEFSEGDTELSIYGMRDRVPVGIFNQKLWIDFAEIRTEFMDENN